MQVNIKENQTLHFQYATHPDYHNDKSASFQFEITAVLKNKIRKPLFKSRLYPAANKSHRGWQRGKVSLSHLEDQTINIIFQSHRLGSNPSEFNNDSFWGGIRVGDFKRNKNDINLVLISLDTLRADRLGISGYFQNTSPYIDSLANTGVYMQEAISDAPWTTPSHMSLMTGLKPRFHHVGLKRQDPGEYIYLDDNIITLAEMYQSKGYLTQAITGSANMAPHLGFYQGFDQYQETPPELVRGDAEFVFNEGMNWLEKNVDNKFFLFLHTFEIHYPYFRKEFEEFDYIKKDPPSPNPNIEARYDSGILYTDRFIGLLTQKLKTLNILEDTLIIIVSDHGEELFQRNYILEHGHILYDEMVRIPMIFHLPKRFPPRKVIGYQAQLSDIMPTIMDLFGITSLGYPIQGKSLLPILDGKEIPKVSIAISEAQSYKPERISVRFSGDEKYKLILTYGTLPYSFHPYSYEYEDQVKKVYAHASLVSYLHNNRREFFNLNQDPFEKINLSHLNNPDKNHIQNIVDTYINMSNQSEGNDHLKGKFNNDLIERLKSLGYL